MKINKNLIMILLIVIASIFCTTPVFIQLNISNDPLKVILSFVSAIPMYYIFSQIFLTILLGITALFFRIKLVYSYFLVLAKLGTKFYFRAFLNQIIGFTPSAYLHYSEEKSYKNFFVTYYILYFLSMIGYYLLFTVIYQNPLFLPLIPFSIIIVIIQKLYETEYQQLFLLKSKVLTILETRQDCNFLVKDYQEIWKLNSKSELPFIALSYISLVKNYLSDDQDKIVEQMEEERLNDKNYFMGLYGMLDVIKLNLYIFKNKVELRQKYQDMLNVLLKDKPEFFLVESGIHEALDGHASLSLSFAISEVSLYLERYY